MPRIFRLTSICISGLLLFRSAGRVQAKEAEPKFNTSAVVDPAITSALSLKLPEGALADAARWQMLEGPGPSGSGKSSWRAGMNQSAFVQGALAAPLAVGSLQRSSLSGSLRFHVPTECADWTSVALAFYGKDNARTYAMVIFKHPDAPVGQGELLVEGSTRIACSLTPGAWYTLGVKEEKKTLAVKVWADSEPEPKDWTLQVSASNPNIDRVGVRTFAGEVEVADLQMSGKSGQTPPLDRSLFPQPIFDREPGYVDLYWKACELASAHVLEQPGLPQPRYMDEALWDDTIWIWDTCFMALYSRYSPRALPGIESL